MSAFGDTLAEASTSVEAATAASAVIDEILPGGAAISIDTPELAGGVVEAFDGGHQFQSFVLAVLVSVARWLGTWKRVASPDPQIAALVAAVPFGGVTT